MIFVSGATAEEKGVLLEDVQAVSNGTPLENQPSISCSSRIEINGAWQTGPSLLTTNLNTRMYP